VVPSCDKSAGSMQASARMREVKPIPLYITAIASNPALVIWHGDIDGKQPAILVDPGWVWWCIWKHFAVLGFSRSTRGAPAKREATRFLRPGLAADWN
jgi:hypothetical protein